MPNIKFVNEKKEIDVPVGTILRKAAIQAGVNTNQGLNGLGANINKHLNCRGFGQCGTCRVLITEGMENVSKMGLVEKCRFRSPVPTPVTPFAVDPTPFFAVIGNEETMRLACQVKVNGDIEVVTGPEFDLFGTNFFS